MYADTIRFFPNRRRNSRHASTGRCALQVRGSEHAGTIRNISAAGAFVETECAVSIDEFVTLVHPEAGQLQARVVRIARDGAALAFTLSEQAATFALSAICANMTVRVDAACPEA